MTTRTPYPDYKPSGIDWLGDIPIHWEVRRAKYLLREVDIRSADGSEELLTVSESDGVVPRASRTVTMFMAENYAGYKLCWPGDLVINSLWAWHGGLGVSKHHGIISSAYGVYRDANGELDPNYLNYAIRSVAYDREFHVRSKGIWVSRLQLTDESFLGMPLVLPPLDEQRAIADYLDRKDAEITRFIESRRRMIALLEEKKQAIINQAVTRGLDPSVPMKDSGVEWLGEIPAHWEVRRMRSLTTHITSGSRDWSQYYADSGDLFIRIGNLSTSTVDLKMHAPQYVSAPEGPEADRSRVLPGDILISITAQMGAIGVVPSNFPLGYINQHVAIARPREISGSRYLGQFLISGTGSSQFDTRTQGGTKLGLGLDDIANLIVTFPPIEEQRAIAEHLDRVDHLILQQKSRMERGIELMQEYRTRLIGDVVTGKVRVD